MRGLEQKRFLISGSWRKGVICLMNKNVRVSRQRKQIPTGSYFLTFIGLYRPVWVKYGWENSNEKEKDIYKDVQDCNLQIVFEFDLLSSTWHEFHLVEWALISVRKSLTIPITFVPLLHQWAYNASSVIFVAHWPQSCIRLVIIFFPNNMHRTFQHYELVTGAEDSNLVPAWFLQFLWLKYVVSSGTGSFHQVLESNHEKWQFLIAF